MFSREAMRVLDVAEVVCDEVDIAEDLSLAVAARKPLRGGTLIPRAAKPHLV